MKYKITVIKYEDNKNYEAEMARWKEQKANPYGSRYNGMDEEPQQQIQERSLEVFLTEKEYEAMKKSILSTFE